MKDKRSNPEILERSKYVNNAIIQAFSAPGWNIKQSNEGADSENNFIVRSPNASYAIQAKIASEGRSDRLIPAWSQAYLVAKHAAGNEYNPLVVIAAPLISESVAKQLIEFAENYAPDAAIGILDFQGLRIFRGPHLEGLNSVRNPQLKRSKWAHPKQRNLFSDLNQWMLKVLLASELPANLINAQRKIYRNASELAEAANVSVMSAFRLIEQLREEEYLDELDHLNLVRRRDLFRRWQSASAMKGKEVPVKLILRSDPKKELDRILRKGRKCLGLFAAADALKIGFVHGVPPHIYISKIDDESIAAIANIRPVEKNEQPDFILRQPSAAESVFRGCIDVNGIPVSDVLQIWLDVSFHPARGIEQADLIQRQILDPIF